MRFRGTVGRGIGITVAAAVGVMVLAEAVVAQTPLRRDLASYFILASKFVKVKNLQVTTPCNVGVNCAASPPKKKCGQLFLGAVDFATGSQAVGLVRYPRSPFDRRLGRKEGNLPGKDSRSR